MRSIGTALLFVAAWFGPPQLMGTGVSTLSRPYSAGVVITTFTRQLSSGPSSFILMVLWRGEPGWYTKDGPRGGRGGGTSSSTYTVFQSGGLSLRVDLMAMPREVRIQDKAVTLDPPEANVILVDTVDSPTGLAVVKTLSIEPSMPDGQLRLEAVLRRSKETVTFLKCDQEIQNVVMSGLVKHNCDLVLGR